MQSCDRKFYILYFVNLNCKPEVTYGTFYICSAVASNSAKLILPIVSLELRVEDPLIDHDATSDSISASLGCLEYRA